MQSLAILRHLFLSWSRNSKETLLDIWYPNVGFICLPKGSNIPYYVEPMNILSDIEKIQSKTFLLSFFSLTFLIVPGANVIFLLDPSLYSQMEILKIIFLSIGIILPFFIIGIMQIFISGRKGVIANPSDFLFDSTISLFFSTIVIYISLIISYFLKLNATWHFIIMIIIQVFLSLFLHHAFNHQNKI